MIAEFSNAKPGSGSTTTVVLGVRLPVAIREAARRVGRDFTAVHGGVMAPLQAGLVDRTDAGRGESAFGPLQRDALLHTPRPARR